jgi:c-di-GMP-related signal transduction protein
MEVFVATQPIFNIKEKIVAYELLFRPGSDNYYNGTDGNNATNHVIATSFTIIGIEQLTFGKRAFINFTESHLINGTPLLLNKDEIVVEILESVKPTVEIINVCKKLKALGYILALDDFVFSPEYEPLFEIVDIVKVDFTITKGAERGNIIKRKKNKAIQFLAEKVETMEEYKEAIKLGYTYFQGYFFSKPTITKGKDIPSNVGSKFNLLKAVSQENFDINEIENAIKMDVSFSYKFLKYINSASFGFSTEIVSIKQAIILLGKEEVIKWLSLLIVNTIGDNKKVALVSSSMRRAKFGELIAPKVNFAARSSDIFIMEMFSSIDALLEMPMVDVLEKLLISKDVKIALLGGQNRLKSIHELIKAYFQADWYVFSIYAKELNLKENDLPKDYISALEWGEKVAVG